MAADAGTWLAGRRYQEGEGVKAPGPCAKCGATVEQGATLLTRRDGSLICTRCAGGQTMGEILHDLNQQRKEEA